MVKNKKKSSKRKQTQKRSNKNKIITTIVILGIILILGYLFINKTNNNNKQIFEDNNQLNTLMNGLVKKWNSLNLTNVNIDEKIKLSSNKSKDSDGDGISDVDEKEGTLGYVTDPNNPDTDGDGLSDLREYWWHCDPTNPDTNGDFISDGDSVNKREAYPYKIKVGERNTLGSYDQDGDGLPTAVEKYELGSDYKSFSTDGDRYGDGQEYFGLDTKNEELPSYVVANMFVPAVPDVGIRVHPKIEINLAQSVKIGNNNIKKGEHEYKTEKESTQTTTFSTGAKATVSASIGWPPWKSDVETTVEGYAGVDYSSSSRMSKIVTNTKTSSEEIYRSKEVDLAGSTLQIWIDIVNKGTDIMRSSLKEITLNFYMGNDKLPFYTKTIENELTNLKPNEKLTITVDQIPLNFKLYQRLLAGETIEVRNPHYSFGEDQLFLETAKANSIQIDIVNETDTQTFYAIPRKKNYSLTQALDLAKINYTMKGGNFIEINNKSVQTEKKPYKWFKLLVTKKNGKETPISNLKDIVLNKGDRVLFKHYIDSDGDLLSDEEEVKFGTDPNNIDTDGDGLSDGYSIPEKGILGEATYGSNPLALDTDGDGFSDYVEVIGKGDPINKSDYPKLPVLFEHINYQGKTRVLTDKILNLSELKNKISSIYVPKGKAVIYYFGPKLEGEGKLLLYSASFLGDDNDKIVSLKVVDIKDLPNVKIKVYNKDKCIYTKIKDNGNTELYDFNYLGIKSNIKNVNKGVKFESCKLNENNLLWKLDLQDNGKFNLISLENKDENKKICLSKKNIDYYNTIPYLENCGSKNNKFWTIDLIGESSSRYYIFNKDKYYSKKFNYYLSRGENGEDLVEIGKSKDNSWNLIVPSSN